MTPVPPEIVRRAAEALGRHHWDGTGCGTNGTSGCSYCYGPSPADSRDVAGIVLAAVYGDIVEAARRDALTEAAEAIAQERDDDHGYRVAAGFDEEPCDVPHGECHAAAAYFAFDTAARIVTDLATAPRTAPAATVSDEEQR